MVLTLRYYLMWMLKAPEKVFEREIENADSLVHVYIL